MQNQPQAQQYAEGDPRHHTTQIKDRLNNVMQHLREDVGKVSDAKAQALFEVSAEVIGGLIKAFDDYERKNEEAWRKS